jgi:hypothetical protein
MLDGNRLLHHEENKFKSNIKFLEPLIFIQTSISCGREFHPPELPTEYTLISIHQVALSMQRAQFVQD